MTAEKMRELSNKVYEEHVLARLDEHKKFAKNIILGKIKRVAAKGGLKVDIKVPKRLTQMTLGETFEEYHYQVKYFTRKGKRFITVSW